MLSILLLSSSRFVLQNRGSRCSEPHGEQSLTGIQWANCLAAVFMLLPAVSIVPSTGLSLESLTIGGATLLLMSGTWLLFAVALGRAASNVMRVVAVLGNCALLGVGVMVFSEQHLVAWSGYAAYDFAGALGALALPALNLVNLWALVKGPSRTPPDDAGH
jgi:hypothetical protein